MILLGPLPPSFAAASLGVTFLLLLLAMHRREDVSRVLSCTVVSFCFMLLAFAEATILLGSPFWWNYLLLPLAGTAILVACLRLPRTRFPEDGRVILQALSGGVCLAAYLLCRPYIEDSLRRGAIHVDVLQYALPEAIGLVRFGPLSVTGEYPGYFFGWELIGLYFIPCCSAQVFGALTALPFVAFVGAGLPRSTSLSAVMGAAITVATVMLFVPGHNPSTKNDLATALFLATGVLFAQAFLRGDQPADLCFSAASFALASSMKPPALLVSAAAFCFLTLAAPRHRPRIILFGATAAAILALWVLRYCAFCDYSPVLHEVSRQSALYRVAPRLFAEGFMVEPNVFLLAFAVGVGAGLCFALSCWLRSLGPCALRERLPVAALFLSVVGLAAFGALLVSPYLIVLLPETKMSWLQLRLAYPLVFVVLAAVLGIADGFTGREAREIPRPPPPLGRLFSHGINGLVVAAMLCLLAQPSGHRDVMAGNAITVQGTPTKVYDMFSRIHDASVFNVGLINAGLLGDDFSNRVSMARPEEIITLESSSPAETAEYLREKLERFDYVALAQSRQGTIALDVEDLLREAWPPAKKVFDDGDVVVFSAAVREATSAQCVP